MAWRYFGQLIKFHHSFNSLRCFSSVSKYAVHQRYSIWSPALSHYRFSILRKHFAQSATPSSVDKIDENIKKNLDEQQMKDDKEEQKRRDASWRAMKYSFWAFGLSFSVFGVYLFVELGSPQKDEDGQVILDEFTNMPFLKQYFLRMLYQLDYYKKAIREPSRKKLLPDPVKYPYIQPPYTLVLELKDVLVHPDWTYNTGWRFKKRPGIDKFLEQIAPPMFEIVVYTAEQGITAFPILDALDPNGYIMYRLVRDATHFVDGHHVKDLDCLNRDLRKVIVIDWDPNSVKLHPNNVLFIKRWSGNDDDTSLFDLASFLRTIVSENVSDVREVLQYYHQFDDPLLAFRENQRKLIEQMEEEEKARAEREKSQYTSKWGFKFNKIR